MWRRPYPHFRSEPGRHGSPWHRPAALSLPLALVLALSALAVGAASGASVSLHMIGEPARSNPNGEPVLVAGIWHEFLVNLTGTTPASMVLTLSLPGGAPQSMASDYRWEWDASTARWSDPYYGTFVRDDLSSTDGTHFSVTAGIDAQATTGRWTLRVFEGSTELTSRVVEVQGPSLSYAISAADFVFQVEPFQSADVSSQAAGQYVRAINGGNVPLQAAVAFDGLQSQLSLQNPADTAHPGSDARYYLRLSLEAGPPRVLRANGVSRVSVSGLIPSPGSAVLIPSVEQSFAIRVFVGRSGYAVKEVGTVVFQTLESIRVDYGAIATWQVYLTGDQSVSLSISAANANFRGAFSGGESLSLPSTLALSAASEYPVTVQVEANRAGTGTVTFTLQLLSTGEVQTFTTSILVNGGPAPVSDAAVTYLWIAGSVGASVVFGFVAFSQWRVRRTGAVSRADSTGGGSKGKRGYNARRREQNSRRRDRGSGDEGKGTKARSKRGSQHATRKARIR